MPRGQHDRQKLAADGLITRDLEKGTAAPRRMLTITAAGRAELVRQLTSPAELVITDENRWFCLLAFLRHLEDPAAQAAVLRRRLAFLTQPAGFFYDGDRPLRAADFDDPFRQGLMRVASATSRTEIQWLRETLASLESQGA